jgi:peptide/nickel transport system permease protein
MLRIVLRRLTALIPVLFGVSIVVFALVRFVPGDPAVTILGVNATEEDIQRIRDDLRLDDPLPLQYAVWLGKAARGDLGRSITARQPVLPLVLQRFKNSFLLAATAVSLSAVLGISVGVFAALQSGRIGDRLSTGVALLGHSVPAYWLGLIFILIFAVELGWLPTGGMRSLRGGGGVLDIARHLVLPTVTLALAAMGTVTRVTRSAMLEVLRQDYVRTARAKGLRERVVVFRHALRNAIIPVLNVVGLQMGFLLGASVIIEQIFAWPGAGQLVYDAISRRDYPVLQGAVLVIATTFVGVNLLVDLLSACLDPRANFG